MADTAKPRTKSAQGLARIKAELVKSKLENRRSRTCEGTPIAYSSIKENIIAKQNTTKLTRESRSFSDPDISGSLIIFSEANGLFSKARQVSSFKGNSKDSLKACMASEERAALISPESVKVNADVKDLKCTFEHYSLDGSNQQHMTEFSNPLHKGNQARFRKGGGVLSPKPVIGPKPVVTPKPPQLLNNHSKSVQQIVPPKESTFISSQCSDEENDDGLYAKVLHERPSIPSHPPPRKLPNMTTEKQVTSQENHTPDKHPEEILSSKEQKDIPEKESSEPPIYAQVDKSKKTNKMVNKRSRSDSDPSPSNINIASGIKFEIAQQPQVKQSDAIDNEEADSDDDSEGWDPSEFDDDDDDFSDFELSSGENSRSNSQDGKEMMNFPDERSKKLYNIAHEILTTERAYVRRLHLLDQVFCFRLQNECLAHGHITADVLHDVFSNISAIHTLHKDFLLPKLEERMSQWSTANRIGDILKTLAPFLKLYTAYIANFDKSSETLATWTKKSPVFASIIEDIQKSKECENLTLGHHMLEPIQRIPRYKLLLKDYLGKLPEESPDYKDTQEAMEIISEAAAHANESMKKMESFKKLLEIQERITEDYSVVTAGRQLIKEGDLSKVAARHVAHQERTLLLFNDVLLCCAKLTGTNKLKVKVEMDLYGMEIGETDEDDEVELTNTFRVTSKQKVIDFSASSEEERETWIKEINDAIQEISRKRETYKRGSQSNVISKSELGKKAPVWVRDEAVTMCMLCDSLFTLTKRRHHCRACGGIFCNTCCHRKVLLEYSAKHERVCQKCYRVLVRGKSTTLKRTTREHGHHDVKKISSDSKVILSGFLRYKGCKSSDKHWVKRWCVLSNTFEFYCYKAKKDTKADFSLPLPGYVVDKPNMADNLDKKIAFKLHHKNVVVHYFSTDSEELLQRWMHNLSYAVKAERIPEEEPKESNAANTI